MPQQQQQQTLTHQPTKKRSYVGASYVKWVEAAGGRVAPIRFYASDAELRRLFDSVNGLIFPGGLTWLWLDAPYVVAARKLFTWALEANDAGDVFPVRRRRLNSSACLPSPARCPSLPSTLPATPLRPLQNNHDNTLSPSRPSPPSPPLNTTTTATATATTSTRPPTPLSFDGITSPDPRHVPRLPAAAHPRVQHVAQRPARRDRRGRARDDARLCAGGQREPRVCRHAGACGAGQWCAGQWRSRQPAGKAFDAAPRTALSVHTP